MQFLINKRRRLEWLRRALYWLTGASVILAKRAKLALLFVLEWTGTAASCSRSVVLDDTHCDASPLKACVKAWSRKKPVYVLTHNRMLILMEWGDIICRGGETLRFVGIS